MRPTRRAGLTLLEVVIVTAIVAVLAIFLAGTIVTSTTMNRDTYIENEIVDLANRAADDMAGALAGAGRFTDCWDISNVLAGGIVAGDVLEFQDVRTDASGNKIYGARTVRRASDPNAFSDYGVRRLVFIPERTYNEVAFNLDIDGDGLRTNTAVVVGRMELRTYLGSPPPPAAQAPFSTTEQQGLRVSFGGRTTRFCQRPGVPASTGVTAHLLPIFGRTPYTGLVSGTFYEFWPRARQIVRTEDDVNEVVYGGTNHSPCDTNGSTVAGLGGEEFPEAGRTPSTFYPRPVTGDSAGTKVQTAATTVPSILAPSGAANEFTEPFGAPITEPDTAVRINLRVVYNPTPDSRGSAELHALSLTRTVSLQ